VRTRRYIAALIRPESRGVHESDSFIHEVTEAVRQDRFYAFLRRWGWLIGAVLLLIVGGAAAHEWRKARARTAAEAAGDALRTAYAEADPAQRAERLAELAAAEPSTAAVAELARAGSLLEAGDRAGAAAVLGALAEGDTPEPYRALAALQRVMVLGPEMDRSERLATLELLTADGAPFRPLALEQRALVHLEAGDRPAAIADLEAALATPGVPEALAGRARQLLVAAGAGVPADATAADG
jgi:hypothetical protein